MKIKKIEFWLIIFSVAFFFLLIANISVTINYEKKIKPILVQYSTKSPDIDSCERSCKLYDLDNLTFTIGGIYYENWFYCINIENTNMQGLKYRETHEQCHHMVFEDNQHFCG